MSAEQHSLVTEILTDFSPSTQSIGEFVQKIDALNKAFDNISKNVENISDRITDFDFNLGERLNKALEDIKKSHITVDGRSLKQHIEESLADAIINRRVVFTDLTDDLSTPLELKINNEKIRKKLVGKLSDYLTELAGSVELPTDIGEGLTIELNKTMMKNLRQRFRTALTESIDKHVKFKVEGDEPLIKQLPISTSQVNLLLRRFAEDFQKILHDPKFVSIDREQIQPVQFSSEQLKQAIERVQQAIGNIDEHLGAINTKELENIPNVSEKLKLFKTYVQHLTKRVLMILSGIDNMKPEDTEQDYAKLQQALQNMHKVVEARVLSVVKAITKEVKDMQLAPSDFRETLSVMEGIQDQIRKYLLANIKAASDSIEQALNIQTLNIDGKKVKAPSIRKLQQHVLKAAEEALQNLDIGDLSIDVAKVRQMFKDWATDTSNRLQVTWLKSLAPLQQELIASNKAVIDEFVQNIISLSKVKLTGGETENTAPIDIEIDTKNIRQQVEKKLKEVVNSLVSNVSFSEAGERALEEGIKLPKKVADTLNKTVRELLETQASKLAEQVQERKGIDFTEAQLEKFDKALFEQSSKLIQNIVQQAQLISSVIAEGVESSGFKTLGTEEQNKIKEHFGNASAKIINDFTSMMDNALGAFLIAEHTMEVMQKAIEDQLNRILTKKDIKFADHDLPLVLQGLVGAAQDKLQEQLKQNIENWKPELDDFKLTIDYENITNPIQQAINKMLNRVGQEVANRIGAIIVPKKTIQRNQEIIENADEPTLKVSTKDLHKDVRKYLADEMEMKVKDWEKMIPAYEGEEGLSKVMAANIAVIMQKFHDVIAEHTKKAIDLYHQELDNVPFNPNTEAVNFLAIKLDQMQDAINKRIKKAIEDQFDIIAEAIKNIRLKPFSIAFDDGDFNEAFKEFVKKNIKNASEFTKGKGRKQTVDESDDATESTDDARASIKGEDKSFAFDRQMPVPIDGDLPSVYQFDPYAIPSPPHRKNVGESKPEYERESVFDPYEELDLYIRGARIAVENAKNRFRNKLDPRLEADFFDYLDNRYMPEVLKVARYAQIASTPEERADVRVLKTQLAQELKMAIEIVRKELAGDKFENQLEAYKYKQQGFIDDIVVKTENIRTRFLGSLDNEQYEQLDTILKDVVDRAASIGNQKVYDLGDMVNLDRSMKNLERELKALTAVVSRTTKENTFAREIEMFEIKKAKFHREVDRVEDHQLVPEERIKEVREQINNLRNSAPDIARLRLLIQDLKDELKKLKALEKEREKDARDEKRKGDLLAQHELLKGNVALQNEMLIAILKTIPALSRYEIEQIRVNNATDTWSARLRDAEGNVRSLSGTIDRATGELYQHSEALSLAIKQANQLNSIKPSYSAPRISRNNVFDSYYQKPDYDNEYEFNPNGNFMSSVVNTMRYITAGALIGAPSMAFWSAWESAKEFDYQMERARQNFLIKGDLKPENWLRDVAEQRVMAMNGGTATEEEIEKERQELLKYAYGKEARKKIQDIAIRYAIDTQEVAKAFHIGSRSVDDPKEAMVIAEAVARGNAIEEIDTEVAASGLESVMNQYGVRGFAANRIMDMMIMAAQFSPAKLEDFLAMQQRAGAIFRDSLPNMTKEDAIATSIGLTGIFSASTARSGAEAGTFFKAFLPRFFSGEGLKALEEVSKQKGFEELNPYRADGSKKDFIEVLTVFLEKTMTLNDQQRMDLWKKVVPGWHLGSASAMEQFLQGLQGDLEKQIKLAEKAFGEKAPDTDKDGVVSKAEALQWYFDRIKEANPEQIRLLQQGTLSTWEKRTQAVKTMWQASTFEVFEELKDEFSEVVQYLNVFLRMIRDNAEEVATAITLASKIAIGLGARFAWSKLNERIDEADKEYKQEKYGKIDRYLGSEQQVLNLRRLAIQEQIQGNQGKLMDIVKRREEINQKLNDPERLAKRSELEQMKKFREDAIFALQASHDPLNGIDNSAAISRNIAELNKLQREIEALDAETERLKRSLDELEQEEKQVQASSEQLNNEMRQVNKDIQSVNSRVQMLAMAYQDLGLDTSKLKTQIMQLDNEFTSGVADAKQYEQAIENIGKQAGLSDDQITKLRQEIDRINQEFREGKIDAQQYMIQMERLERAHMTGQAGLMGGGIGKSPDNQSGIGLMEAIMAGSMFAPLMMGKRGIIQRIKDFATTKSLKDLFGKGEVVKDPMSRSGEPLRDRHGNVIYKRDLIRQNKMNELVDDVGGSRFMDAFKEGGKLEGIGKGVGRVGVIARQLKVLPGLGQALLAFEALNWGMDAMTSMGMTKGEKAVARAENLKDMVVTAKSIDEMSWFNPLKYLGGLSLGTDMAFQGLNSLLGGNGVSFGNSMKIIGAMLKNEGEALDNALQKENFKLTKDIKGNLEEVKDKSERLYEEERSAEEQTDPFGDSLDELTNAIDKETQALLDLSEKIGKIEDELQRNLSINQSEFTIEQSKLLLSGVREDSQQMRDLFEEYLKKNIAFIDAAIEKIRTEKANISDKNSEEYKNLEAREKELQAQRAQSELQLHQNEMSEYDEIMNKLAEDLKKVDTEYGIQKSEAQLQGASTDSTILKKIEAERVNKSNALIEQAQRDLEQLIKVTNAQGSELAKIQQSILDLEKEQKDNLVSIKNFLEKEKSTFNLPSDVQPISYMDYMMRNQTHKNITTKTGDVTINLTIGTMSGSDSDVKKMTDALTDAIKKANQQMAQTLNNQVLAGMGKGYF
jgi:TP901 family phage tail tape measure protein